MRFSRARYVTLCQQSLVTAAVLAVGLSAAGVKTLDIVPQPGTPAGDRDHVAGATPGPAEVDTAPVTPKVREVAVTATSPQTSGPPARPQKSQRGGPAETPAPGRRQSQPASPDYVKSAPERVHGYATVGVTWKNGVTYTDDQISLEIRTRDKGAWSTWTTIDYHDDHGPDAASDEEESARVRPGTDALVIGDVDLVQLRAKTTGTPLPPDLRLAIVDPGTGEQTKQGPAIDTSELASPEAKGPGAGDPQASGLTTLEGDGVSDTVQLSAMTRPARPRIYSRAQWGANERMREQSAPDYGTVKTGFVHHTVNANSYSSAQVPSLLRGIYAYHTQSRGWRDIGYNFLVDRFGRIWEGRWGGVSRPVVGAHTLGYNEVSFAMSAIGNFETARPPVAMLNAYARLFAWKLAIHNIPANRTRIAVKGRYLQAINGHRDAGQTACPGRYLYAQLPYIRSNARRIQNAAQSGSGTTPPPTPAPTPAPKPPVFTSPTQKARPAVAQPSTIKFPRALNQSGTHYPDLVMRGGRGVVRVLPTGGQTAYRSIAATQGSWRSMGLLSAVGDVTSDGRGDVLGRVRGVTRVFRGDGVGHVSRVGIMPTKTFRYANRVVAAGDWNGDRRNDVLMRHRINGGLYLVPGRGGGSFGRPFLLAWGWAKFGSIAVPGDVTGDRRPDVVGVSSGVLRVFRNVPGSRLGEATQQQDVGSYYNAILGGARDATGDGVGDVLVRSTATGQLGVRTGRTGGTFGNTVGWFRGARDWTRLSAAQMSGGPQADLVGIGPSGTLLVLANNGLTNTQGLVTTNVKVPGASMVINAGDWNRDGRGDIITRENDEDRLVLRPGQGNGRYGAGITMSNGWKRFVNLVGLGDVTGDGRPDLMGRVVGGPMTIFPGNGSAKFQAPILAPASMRTFNQIGVGSWRPGAMPRSSIYGPGGGFVPFVGTRGRIPKPYNWVVGPGDVDGDGRPDLVARDDVGVLWLLPGTTSGYGPRRFLASGFRGYASIG